MKSFNVEGYAMVPVKVSIRVEAENVDKALDKANRTFDFYRGRRSIWIIPGSEDFSAVHGYSALTATEVKP